MWETLSGETPIDPSGLKDKSIKTRFELSRAEAINISKPYAKYLSSIPDKRIAPFEYSWLLRLHKEMYCDVWEWAGELRQENLNIGIDWDLISMQIFSLIQDLDCWKQNKMPFLEQTARLHYHAVHIHPFMNGNGRWSRLMANIWLKKHRVPIILWPEETIGQESIIRTDYLKSLRDADNGDFSSLLALHQRYQEEE